jgi:hypothetical protein
MGKLGAWLDEDEVPTFGTDSGFRNWLDEFTKPETGDSFIPTMLGVERVDPEDLGSTISLTAKQRQAERAARRESHRLERQFYRMGRGEEWEEFKEKEGKIGNLEEVSKEAEDVLTPLFDLLSLGQYGAAGFFQELLRTGSAWEGFKQSAIEMANALPGVELDKARKPSYINVLKENGIWGATAAGLVLDLVADPMNLVPGALLAKGLTKGAKEAKAISGPLGKAFDFIFTPKRQLLEAGEAGEATLQHYKEVMSGMEAALEKRLLEVERFYADLMPHERRLLGTFMEQPKIMNKHMDDLLHEGFITSERRQEILGRVEEFRGLHRSLFDEAVSRGLIDPSVGRKNYLFGTQVVDRRARTALEKQQKERQIALQGQNALPGANIALPSSKAKKWTTVADRLMAFLSGKVNYTTEIDIGNATQQKLFEHYRWLASRDLVDLVIADGRINARVAIDPKHYKTQAAFDSFRQSVKESTPGYDVLAVTRAKRVNGRDTQEIIGAHVLPERVVSFVENTDKLLKSQGDLEVAAGVMRRMTNVLKGWMTFTPGFHSRNYQGGLWMNWLAGVGSKQLFKDTPILKHAGITVPERIGRGFLARHLQAWKLQAMVEGKGQLPEKLKGILDEISQHIGGGDFTSVELPKIVVDGKTLGWEDVIELGQRYGVPQSASKMWDVSEDFTRAAWQDLEPSVALKMQESKVLSPLLKQVMGMQAPMSKADQVMKLVGGDNPILKMHRGVGTTFDNNARWALFIDRLAKGAPPQEAAEAVKTWQFDYRNLTDIEQRLFSTMIPFYAWTRFAVPRLLMAAVENPGKMARVPKVERFLREPGGYIFGEQEEKLPTPDYYDEVRALHLNWARNSKPLSLSFDLPIITLNNLNKQDVLSSLHPFIKRTFESVPSGGMNFFTGMQEEEYPGEPSKEFPFLSRSGQATLEAFVPPFGQVVRMERARQRGELPEQLASVLGGVKVRALDVRRVLRAQTFEKRKLARSFAMKLRKEAEAAQM